MGPYLAQARATAGTVTSLTVPLPDAVTAIPHPNCSGLSAGPVTVQLFLQTGASSFSLLGSAVLTVLTHGRFRA